MQIIEVSNNETHIEFLQLPKRLYQHDAHYISPLDKEINDLFNSKKNSNFKNGDVKRWILKKDQKVIGRIAAFYLQKPSLAGANPYGGCGFFECMNDLHAATLLFDAAKDWLLKLGFQGMDGPINWGNRDRFWGVLVEGYSAACYGSTYNLPYYKQLFEAYGFNLHFRQFTYKKHIADVFPEAYRAKTRHIIQDSNYSFSDIQGLPLTQVAEQFREIYNSAWKVHADIRPLSEQQTRQMIHQMKALIDPKLIWFAYYQQKAIACYISIPDLNELLLKHIQGRLTWKGKLLFLWNKIFKNYQNIVGLVFGVHPDFQRKAVEMALIIKISDTLREDAAYRNKDVLLNWIGDFNPKMIHVVKKMGAQLYKVQHTYRLDFDKHIYTT